MKNLNELTVIILTYHTSKKIILECIRAIDKNVNILIGQLDLKSRIEITRLNKNVNINT